MEENFDQLRKLLALKRYEQAPPGYFNSFSTKVLARIESAEMAEPSWLQKLGFQFDFKPALIGACGILVCGLLSIGILTSAVGPGEEPASGYVMVPPVNSYTVPPFNVASSEPESTQPVFSASRFDQFGLRPAPASFQFNK